jgi:uncharacterized protein (TIGR00299 family) protein
MRTLYFDCFAGASGDMILAALIDAGVGRETLVSELRKLAVPGFDLEVVKVHRAGISAVKANVKVPHEHQHRNLRDIEEIIENSALETSVKVRAINIFRRLGEAEAKVHGMPVGEVHFHEVGAMDSIIDIVGCCVGFDLLGIERFASSRINVGNGFVRMAHGTFPVPPPAVAELLKGVPIFSNEIEGELTTPTGAAIISTLSNSYGSVPEIRGEVIGYGAGSREYEKFPNVLRTIIGDAFDSIGTLSTEDLVLLETNIDDLSPQVSGYVLERSLELGALDSWLTPIVMKKNRPGVLLSVLCSQADRARLSEFIFRETSTIGLRSRRVERQALERETITVGTEFGPITVKIARLGDEIINVMPEFEEAKSLAEKHGVPVSKIQSAAVGAWQARSVHVTREATA